MKSSLPSSSAAVFVLCFFCCFVAFHVEAQNQTEFYVFQSHTTNFWQVNADDAGTQAGELGFIWHEWDDYPDYHYLTMYQIIANNSYNEYVPCEEGDSCANRYAQYPKHMGMSDMGFVAIPSSSYNDYYDALATDANAQKSQNVRIEGEPVQYFDFTWYSLPKGGVCPPGEPLGTNNCGFYAVCAVKTVARSCISKKPGWKHYMNINYYGLWAITQLAFQETELSLGGCPDVTYDNFTVCKDAQAILRNPESFGKIPDPRKPPADELHNTKTQKRSLPPKEEEEQIDEQDVTSGSKLSSPLLGIDPDTNSLCRIMGNETDPTTLCKPMLYFDPPLDRYAPQITMSSSTPNGLVFVHLKSRPSAAMGCEPARIIGYHYETNSVTYNFTLDFNLDWFEIDMNDGHIVGLLSVDGSVFRMQVVTISLQTHQATIITPTPIFNNSRDLEKVITYDPTNNIIYFFGIQGYLSYPVFLSYKIPSFTEVIAVDQEQENFNYSPRKLYSPFNSATTVFPIIMLNYSEIFTLSHAPNGNLYAIVEANEGRLIAGVIDPASSLMENDNGKDFRALLLRGESTFDPISNELVFCMEPSGLRSSALASYNVVTQTWYTDEVVDYKCRLLPFRFVYGN